MRARIEVPFKALIGGLRELDTERLNELAGLDSDEGALLNITVGDAEDFIRNVITIALDGPDEAVRPIVTHLMDFIKAPR